MKELREERSVSIEKSKLTFSNEQNYATKPIGAEFVQSQKVVELPTKALLKNVKIIKKDGTKEEYDVQKDRKSVV